MRKVQASSAPGCSGTSYKVYKHCPQLLHQLCKIIRVIWRQFRAAWQWCSAEGLWAPKEGDSRNISQFRIMSVISNEGIILFSIGAKSLADFLLENQCIDTSFQKYGLPGCLDPTGVVTQQNRSDLTVLLLDQLVKEKYYVLTKVKDLSLDYCADLTLVLISILHISAVNGPEVTLSISTSQ